MDPAALGHIPPVTAARLELLATSLQSRRTVLLEGESGCGKTHIVKLLAQVAGRQLVIVDLNMDTGGS